MFLFWSGSVVLGVKPYPVVGTPAEGPVGLRPHRPHTHISGERGPSLILGLKVPHFTLILVPVVTVGLQGLFLGSMKE